MEHAKDAARRALKRDGLHGKDHTVPNDLLPAPPSLLVPDQVHAGLHRLMGLRDAVVALNGPLSNDPGLRDNLHKQLLSEENHDRILGGVSHSSAPITY
jgi:type VI secretion system protein ImpB